MRALIVLCDLGSMGRAAEQMGVTQPAMSKLVSELEKLIETKLFLRHSKGVTPTPVALDLVPIARRMISAAEEGAERIASHQRLDSGLVRVGTTAAATGAILDPILIGFPDAHPRIQVQVNTLLGPTLDASFGESEYDVIFCRRRETLPEGWIFEPCYRDAIVPVCGSNHPIAQSQNITIAELGKLTWLQNHISTLARHKFDELVEREGWKNLREVQILSRESILIWTMLKSGKYVSMVPRSVVAPWILEGLLYEIPVELNLPIEPIGYHWRPNYAGTAVQTFIRALG